MIKMLGVCSALCVLASISSAFARDAPASLPYDGPKTGFFIGVGGSYSESAGYTDTGTLAITTNQRVNAQAFAISINRAF